MSIEKALADQTAAVQENTVAVRALLAALQAGGSVAGSSVTGTPTSTGTETSTSAGSTGKGNVADSNTGGATETLIYWSVPNTEHFGTVESEAEFKKVKKTHAKAIKIPESKYNDLVEAASKVDGDNSEYSERILALIDALPDSPEESDIIELFTGYLPKDLAKDERTARAEIIKPILEGVKAAKATAVKEEDRYDVMVAVIKGIETHLEETGQVSEDDENGLV